MNRHAPRSKLKPEKRLSSTVPATSRPPSPPPGKTKTGKAKQLPGKPPVKLKDPPPTPQSARKQWGIWRAADLVKCRDWFPLVFNAERPVPLAIGIHAELGPVLGMNRAQRLLHEWTRWRPYVAAVAAGGKRYHLDGSEAGEVDAKAQEYARARLAETQQQEAA